jgi:hypothetical protein
MVLPAVADALSRLDIDSLKIKEEEVLTILSGLENNIGTLLATSIYCGSYLCQTQVDMVLPTVLFDRCF